MGLMQYGIGALLSAVSPGLGVLIPPVYILTTLRFGDLTSRARAFGVISPIAPDPDRPFDAVGAVLSAVGMFFVVFGILQAAPATRC